MQWEDVPETVHAWHEVVREPAERMKRAAADVYTSNDVGYYFHPQLERFGIFAPLATDQELALCKAAAVRASGRPGPVPFLSYQGLRDPDCTWVKVAHSPTLRRLGELLNFFPGQYPGGIPNAPSPAAAMLTSGLVGAGLGYGAGTLLEKALPARVGGKLRKTLGITGGVLGALPGAAWAGVNAANNHGITEGWPLEGGPGDLPDVGDWANGGNMAKAADVILGDRYKTAVDSFLKKAFGDEDMSPNFGSAVSPRRQTPQDVNINSMGQTLWEYGASPQLAASTMGALYAAQQIPTPDARPGWATGSQLGQLAANAAGDYVKGVLVGAALNSVIGTPLSAQQYGMGNAALGIIGAVVPHLFGG